MSRPPDPHARDSLLTAARAEFARKGISAARIEDITSACGLSKGAFYLHFPSKEALFSEIVQGFAQGMEQLTERRLAKLDAFFAEHGALQATDFSRRTRKAEELLALEAAEDLNALELMWSNRDVVGVLISGSQGTEFEGMVWSMVDAEVQRVGQSFEALQQRKVTRSDVPAELLGSLIVGTYLLIAKQMSRTKTKPDLATWAQALQRLIREGCAAKFAPKKQPARKTGSRKVQRRTR